MTKVKAGIFGLSGLAPSEEEKRFFTKLNPVGFILFARNCESPEQVKKLTADLRSLSGRDDVLVLIDQEGGRVARLKPPHWRKTPAAGIFAQITEGQALEKAERATYLNARLIAHELYALGINVDCAPLADIPVKGAHNIIGDRAYGNEPHQVSVLGAAMAKGLLEGGVLPVLKHLPGHGRARADSHEELPVVSESLDLLRNTDFVPFVNLASLPLGMTAHIIYSAIDSRRAATLSPVVLELIRKEIGFEGLLMSDDLSMKALEGDFTERTQQSLAAGCDIVLHCNGRMDEMESIAKGLPALEGKAKERFRAAISQLQKPKDIDMGEVQRELDAIIAPV